MVEKDGNLGLARGEAGVQRLSIDVKEMNLRRPAALLELSVLALKPLGLVLSSVHEDMKISIILTARTEKSTYCVSSASTRPRSSVPVALRGEVGFLRAAVSSLRKETGSAPARNIPGVHRLTC